MLRRYVLARVAPVPCLHCGRMAGPTRPGEQIRDGYGENIERGVRVELTSTNLLGGGVDECQTAGHQPADWDIGPKRPLVPPPLDELPNNGPRIVVGASHGMGAEIRSGRPGNVLVAAEFLPTRSKQAPQRVDGEPATGFGRVQGHHRSTHRSPGESLEQAPEVGDMRIDRRTRDAGLSHDGWPPGLLAPLEA